MSRRIFSDWLREFVEYASHGEAPLDMYFWVGVATVAGALRRKVWIDQKYFKWIPNFYIILVAPPGIVSKSTTASIGMNLLRKVPGIHFGPDVVTWQALAQAMANSKEMFDLGNQNYMPMCAITIESGEFGTFLNPSDREMVDLLVSLWDGKEGTFKKLTKTSGEDVIENPFINFIACTTPAWIEGNFPEYMIGGGFTSRSVFVYADQKANYVAYPHLSVPKDFKEQTEKLIHDLEMISMLCGEYTITPEAIEWGTDWYIQHYKNKPPHLDNERFGGYIARKQTHIHKLAMVLAASRKDELTIEVEDLLLANACITKLEGDMVKVFERIGQTDDTRKAHQLVGIVRTHAGITKDELYAKLFRIMSYDDFKAALISAMEAGHVYTEPHEGKILVRYRHG